MKLCWLIPNDNGGGVAAVALSCCRQAAAAGHDVTLLTMVAPSGWSDEFATFRRVGFGLTGNSRMAMPEHLISWLNEHPQDIFFWNSCSESEPAIPYVPAGTRSVYVVHDTASRYWEKAVLEEPYLDAVVAVSHAVAERFRMKLRMPEKLHVLHNGTVFPAAGDESRANDLLFLGGENPTKGAYDVLALWRELALAGFEGRLHWFGRISESFRSRICALPQSSRIVLHGHVPRSKIFETAAGARVVLMLSRVESFGMVTVETMGMGCLPVAWDIETGTKEIVKEGGTGFFAPLGDVAWLAEQVQTACREHERLYQSAMREARERFSEGAMWRGYEQLLAELMVAPSVARPLAGRQPPCFKPPTRYFQLLPDAVRERIRAFIGRSPRLGYWLRDMRGY